MHKLTSLCCDLVHHDYCTVVMQHAACSSLHPNLETAPTINKPQPVTGGVNHTECAVILAMFMFKELLWQCMP